VTAKTGSTASFLPNFVHGRIDRVRVVLIHGSGGNAESAWGPVQPLADRFELVTPNRGGYPPNPPLDRIDFDEQADELAPLLGDGAHLVGHSYGGVIALLIAARRPEAVLSLAVSEPAGVRPCPRQSRGRPARRATRRAFSQRPARAARIRGRLR
jgi:pimeloyl-ACP methyl ester carboxylesterase